MAAAGETDFSTALADADVFGIMGRERLYAASRWTAADSTAPAYQALKLYRNYDGVHHTFAPISVSATNDATDPGLFSSYAAINAAGTTLTVLVINKSPSATVSTSINLNHFTRGHGNDLHALLCLADFNCGRRIRCIPGDLFLCALFGDLTGDRRNDGSSTGRRVGPESRYDHGSGRRKRHAGTEDSFYRGNRYVELANLRQRHHRGAHAAECDDNTERRGDGDRGRNTRLLSLHGNRHGQHRHAADAGRMDRRRQSGGIANEGWGCTDRSFADLDCYVECRKLRSDAAGSEHLVHTSAVLSRQRSNTCNTSARRIATTDSSGNATVTLTLPNGTGQVTVTAEGPWPLGHPVATFTETSN